ncbi:MAG: hypothetical protein V1841_02480 [Patescibacteria group bacterium]
MSLFGNKKLVTVKQVIGQTLKTPEIPGTGDQIYPRQELARELKALLPYQSIGSYLSEMEAKNILRKLRGEEYRAQKSDQKLKFSRLLRLLEEEWGLRGKY